MNRFCTGIVIAFILCVGSWGCASSGLPGIEYSALVELEETIMDASHESYPNVRAQIVETFTSMEQGYATESAAPARRVKRAITGTGVIAGLAATAISFAVKSEDTKTTIAQIGSITAGVGGMVSLIPTRRSSVNAGAIQGYLESELEAFQERWPEDLIPTDSQWLHFQGDGVRMIEMVERLR